MNLAGFFDGAGTRAPERFRCFTIPDTPVIRRWFRKIDVSENIATAGRILDEILRKEIEVLRAWLDKHKS